MEADAAVSAKTSGGQHHDRHDPAENRDVAEQGSGARADAVHIVDRGCSGSGLASAAYATVGVVVTDRLSTLTAVRHLKLPNHYYVTISRGVPAICGCATL